MKYSTEPPTTIIQRDGKYRFGANKYRYRYLKRHSPGNAGVWVAKLKLFSHSSVLFTASCIADTMLALAIKR